MRNFVPVLLLMLFALTNANAQYSQYYSELPNLTTCQAGKLTSAEKQKVLEAVNGIRALHNLKPVVYHEEFDNPAEEAALMMASNDDLNHTPPKSWKCWSQDGYDGAEHTNLFISWSTNPPQSVESIYSWMIDEFSEYVGHRRWIIDPFLKKIAIGRADGPSAKNSGLTASAMALYVIDNDKQDISDWDMDFVAYPYQYYKPQNIYYSEGSATKWHYLSFTYIADKFNYWNNQNVDFSATTITMKDENGNNVSIAKSFYDNEGYGVPNCLKWMPTVLNSEVKYEVTIKGVKIGSNTKDFTYWFKVTENVYTNPPGIVSLTTPKNKATGFSPIGNFAWVKDNNATKYHIQISKNANMSSPIIDDDKLSINGYKPSVKLDINKLYYWRVKGYNDAGWGEWSEVFSFETGSDLKPEKPELISPENNSSVSDINVKFTWKSAVNADSYIIRVSESEDLSASSWDILFSKPVTKTEYQSLKEDAFQLEKDYWWQVTAINPKAEVTSDIWKFRITATGDVIVKLMSPKNLQENVPTTPLLVWHSIKDSKGYNIQISQDDSFDGSQIVYTRNNLADTTIAVPEDRLNPNVVYSWRVQAIVNDITGPWSQIWHFKTGQNTELVTFLYEPSDSSINVSKTTKFIWGKILNATYYHLQVASQPSFSGSKISIEDTMITDTSYQAIQGKLLDKTIYWWRVRGIKKVSHTITEFPWTDPPFIFSTYDKLTSINSDIPVSSIRVEAYPNPPNNLINLSFDLYSPESIIIVVFDSEGKIITELINSLLGSGNHVFNLNCNDLASGVYHYRLIAKDGVRDGSFIVTK